MKKASNTRHWHRLILFTATLSAINSGSLLDAHPSGLNSLLSDSGSGRATAYLESPKIITFEGKTHVSWLDSTDDGFKVRIRTLDHETGVWSQTWTIGDSPDNHGGPALTIDADGFLHVLYYSHHHPLRYRKSLRRNDASAWTEYTEVGQDLTYPAIVCAKDGTLIMVARRSYEEQPWVLEMWHRQPEGKWICIGPVVTSSYPGYAQFAASLSWGPDHDVLHLGTRIYENHEGSPDSPITTVGYLRSHDGGKTWQGSDGSAIPLPANAETMDSIAAGSGAHARVLNAGAIGISHDQIPYVPYSVRVQDSSQGYLAYPMEGGGWRHVHLNAFLPEAYRDWDLFMHGGLSVTPAGEMILTATVMQVAADKVDWGDPSTEVVVFHAKDGGHPFSSEVIVNAEGSGPRWMPNIERPTGFNQVPDMPALIYTSGGRGENLVDRMRNKVWYYTFRVNCSYNRE